MIGTFVIILWLQSIDKNFKKKSNFDKFKIPILASSLVGIIAEFMCDSKIKTKISIGGIEQQDIFTEVANF